MGSPNAPQYAEAQTPDEVRSPILPPGVTPRVLYSELRSIARSYLSEERTGHTLQPTALVHEALLRLTREAHGSESGHAAWQSPRDFFRLAAIAMQRVLIEYARARNTLRRGAACSVVRISDGSTGVLADAVKSIDDSVSVEQLESIQDALSRFEAVDPRAALLVRLRFFIGLSVAQAARIANVSVGTAEADWRIARAWLARELGQPSDRIEN